MNTNTDLMSTHWADGIYVRLRLLGSGKLTKYNKIT